MFQVLRHPVFQKLFAAQVVALLGTGLLTIALGLLAYELAGDSAGQVLGLALTIKMLAYVGLSPVLTALLARANRRWVLIGADLIRAGAALALPFIDAVWQIYVLIFLLQAASASFTPTFQATIPDVLPDEEDYTRALSLSRLAYDLENLASPALAALLLTLVPFSALFAGTVLGFLISAALVLAARLPRQSPSQQRPFLERLTRGSRIYLATPRLRGLLALNVAVAAVGAVVIVLSVVIARGVYGGGEQALAILLGAYGLGSMAVAFALPPLLERMPDRRVMLWGGTGLAAGMLGLGVATVGFGWAPWGGVLGLWLVMGGLNAAVMTPSGRLLRRSARPEDRPAVFAAQFALSHACWLVTYPLAGTVGSTLGVPAAMVLLGLVGALGAGVAWRIWPERSGAAVEHSHADLAPDHPHLQDATRRGGVWVHRHRFVIDDEHRVWPSNG